MKDIKNIVLSLILMCSVQAFSLEKADIIYTGGVFGIPYDLIGELPLGHVGIFAGTEKKNGKIKAVIIDCVPDYFRPGGIRKVSWKNFTHNLRYPYYGNRTTRKKPSTEQRNYVVKIASKMLKPKAYNLMHDSQKGPKEFDCVGFVEYVYEKVGLNPTPDDQEKGMGWPLTPSEQFYNTVANSPSPSHSYISFVKKKDLSEISSFKSIGISAPNDIPIPDSFTNE